jgi:transcriptional regulator with XRE-family HTH domain
MDKEVKALVELALGSSSCSQKELAHRIGVSPTQISKWKKGEHMSHEMEEKIRAMTNIGNKVPSFVLLAGSLEAANKWEKLVHFLAEIGHDGAETGYDTYPLKDEEGLLCWNTFDTLRQMGVDIPRAFPNELDIDYGSDEILDVIHENPISDLIYQIYNSLNDVYGFYVAYVAELINDDDLDLMNTSADNIEPCLMELAASKIEVDEELAPKMAQFRREIRTNYEEWLNVVKDRAFRAGIPLRAELLGMVYDSHDELGHEAEAESLGFNSSRVHPDIYMNELLCGMRMVHQVLPAIMKKLGIYDEFKVDESELRLR